MSKSTGSGYPAINTISIIDMKIRILKPHIITKYKLQEDFDFMDKLKSDISNTLKNQEDVTKQMIKLVLDGNKDSTNISETNKIIPDNLELPEELDEPLNIIKPDLNSNSSSDLEQNKKKSKKSNKNIDIIEEIDSEIKIKTKKNKTLVK
jgi:hypothetical protein